MHRHTPLLGSVLLVALAAAATGCDIVPGTPAGPSWHDPTATPARFDPSTPLAQRVMLVGEMGSETAVLSPNVATTASSVSPYSSSVRIDAEDVSNRWWVMTSVSFGHSLSELAALPIGTEVSGNSVMGCSGPRHGDYTFDHTTSEVLLHVEQGANPTTRLLRFWAAWGGQSVEGAMEVQIP
jgi:hypothetical protein